MTIITIGEQAPPIEGIDLNVGEFGIDTIGPFAWGQTINIFADVENLGSESSRSAFHSQQRSYEPTLQI